MKQALQLVRLNARVARLALSGRWLDAQTIADGYDQVAPTYEEAWQCHLRRATDELLHRLPSSMTGTIADLGSGTGYAAKYLARANPNSKVVAVDVSKEMLNRARQQAPPNLVCVVADMLDFVRTRADESVNMIVSTWALGYSQVARVVENCRRLLPRSGTLAFIINYSDTLFPIFRTFRQCMLRFPNRVKLAAHLRFPKDWNFLQRTLVRNQFQTT